MMKSYTIAASRFGVATLLAGMLIGCGGASDDKSRAQANSSEESVIDETLLPVIPTASISEAGLRARIAQLASDDFEGRAPATPGGQKTRDYLIQQMTDIGLEPGNGTSFEQPVPLVEVALDPARSTMTLGGVTPDYGSQAVFWTKRVVEEVSFTDSDLVFVGYGVVAPEYGWDDYAGIDVTGKTVVMLVNDPGYATQDPDLFNGNAMTYYGRWTYKYEEAARQGAAGAIVIHQTAPASYGWGVVEGGWTGPQLDLERPDGGASRVMMESWVQEEVARDLFARAGKDFDAALEAAKNAGFEPFALGDLKASATIVNTLRNSASANVAGVLRGSERPDEYIVYMAHWDHLGRNDANTDDPISNGAVDNATGTAAILSIAEAFSANGMPPERSIMFVAVTAEESGLLGSAYFGEDPLVPLGQIVGGINIDAMLPMPPAKDIVVVGYGSSELEDVLKTAAEKRGLYLRPDPQPERGSFYRSDHISLSKKGVPMIYADSGVDLIDGGEEAGIVYSDDYTANRYHKPADEYQDDWEMDGMTAMTGLFYEVGATLAYSEAWPNWYEGNEFRALRDAQRAE